MADYYDYDYDQDQGGDDQEVSVENEYYNAKGLEEDGTADEALEAFEKVVEVEKEQGDKGEWGFKSLKHIVKLLLKAKKFKEMMKKYKEMLTYIKSAVTRNMSDKIINGLLDFVATAQNDELLLDFYSTTLTTAKDVKNERLWFRTNLKLAYLYLDKKEFEKTLALARELHQSCQLDTGGDDPKKATSLIEVYALQIQVYSAMNDFPRMSEAYHRCLQVKNAAPSSLVNAVIKEAGGKVEAKSGSWNSAYRSFYDAFHSFDEAGQIRRLVCLKYTALANMMMLSNINPFESPETRPYKEVPEIAPMVALVTAYQQRDIDGFFRMLETQRAQIFDDFMAEFIPQLIINIRTQLLIKMIQPYTTVRIPFLAQLLNVNEAEVESMLVGLVLDKRIEARIDQINKRLLVAARDPTAARKFNKLTHWASQLATYQRIITSKVG